MATELKAYLGLHRLIHCYYSKHRAPHFYFTLCFIPPAILKLYDILEYKQVINILKRGTFTCHVPFFSAAKQ